MKIISFKQGEERGLRAGVIVEDPSSGAPQIVDVRRLGLTTSDGTPVATVRDVLRLGPGGVAAVAVAVDKTVTDNPETLLDAAGVVVGPPVPDPDKIVCLGLNYRDHAAEAGLPVPEAPLLFAKYRNALAGPQDDVVLPAPALTSQVDYEGELAVVIGTRARSLTPETALTCVAGYTVMNDVSARDLQAQTGQWLAGKTFDGFAPCGPALVTADEVPDPDDLRVRTWVNGGLVQDGSTRDMVFGVARQLAFISSVMTLEPGDVVATGTPAGVGSRMRPPRFLTDGDVVEVEVERIGRIGNRFVAATGHDGAR